MKISQFLGLFPKTFTAFSEDKAPVLAAALAFFTIFSIAPILIIIIGIVSLVLGGSAAQGQLVDQLSSRIGPQAAGFLQNIIHNTNKGGGSVWATVVGGIAILVGATGVVMQLKNALNTIWEIKPDPQGGLGKILYMLWSRVTSLLLILLAGILLLVFIVTGPMLYSLGHYLEQFGPLADVFIRIGYYVFFTGLTTLLFALLYQYLPDGRIRWKDLWIGAFITAALFVIGNFLISLYIGRVGVGSAFGAAGSFVLILVWIFYSAQVFLFGAEFTKAYIKLQGQRIEPAKGAVKEEP